MRVYALAKQLGMENRDLIPELKRMGITVASHSSVLDDDVVQKVLEKLGPKLKATGRAAEADTGRGERSKVGMASDHAAGVKAGSAQAASAEESSKSDKRRILIKRKRADDVPAEETASLPTVESVGTGGALLDTLVVSQPDAPASRGSSRCPCRPVSGARPTTYSRNHRPLRFPPLPSSPPSCQASM